MSKTKAIIAQETIKNKIYTIRGMQVMLDRDLAELYQVNARALRQQVKRNIKRFPSDFMFQLTNKEVDSMVSQNVTPSKKYFGGTLPYVFTEQGVSSLSSVLTSEKAIEVNINIIRAFVLMRKFIKANKTVFQRLDNIEVKQIAYETKQLDHDKKFNQVFKALEFNEQEIKQGIFFDGQIFDAFKFLLKLIKKAKKSLVLIDNYIDDSVLTILDERSKNVEASIITKSNTEKMQLLLEKHNKQYSPISIKESDVFHDRFLIIDEKEMYHIGASIKDLGKRCFAFSKIEDAIFVKKVLDKIR